MCVCVIDGRGGGLGSQLILGLRTVAEQGHDLIGIGTNEVAAQAMAQAGAGWIAVGRGVLTNDVQKADLILGSLSIILPGSMRGEITSEIAEAILQAPGRKLLLPVNRRGIEVIGAQSRPLQSLIDFAIHQVRSALKSGHENQESRS